MKTTELKPCKCGNDCFLIVQYRNRIEVKCPKCGLFLSVHGRIFGYRSIAECTKNVWPSVVENWNRRVTDDQT